MAERIEREKSSEREKEERKCKVSEPTRGSRSVLCVDGEHAKNVRERERKCK